MHRQATCLMFFQASVNAPCSITAYAARADPSERSAAAMRFAAETVQSMLTTSPPQLQVGGALLIFEIASHCFHLVLFLRPPSASHLLGAYAAARL